MGLIYSHTVTSIPEISKQFSDSLLQKITDYKEICIFADININLLNDEVTSVTNYLNQFHGFGLKNLYCIPNRVNNLGGTLIGHFYCSNPEKN